MKKDSITRKMKFYEYTTHIRNVTIKIFAQENVSLCGVVRCNADCLLQLCISQHSTISVHPGIQHTVIVGDLQ